MAINLEVVSLIAFESGIAWFLDENTLRRLCHQSNQSSQLGKAQWPALLLLLLDA
jgi:hypothetical protein